jgi:hypothetical protein
MNYKFMDHVHTHTHTHTHISRYIYIYIYIHISNWAPQTDVLYNVEQRESFRPLSIFLVTSFSFFQNDFFKMIFSKKWLFSFIFFKIRKLKKNAGKMNPSLMVFFTFSRYKNVWTHVLQYMSVNITLPPQEHTSYQDNPGTQTWPSQTLFLRKVPGVVMSSIIFITLMSCPALQITEGWCSLSRPIPHGFDNRWYTNIQSLTITECSSNWLLIHNRQ